MDPNLLLLGTNYYLEQSPINEHLGNIYTETDVLYTLFRNVVLIKFISKILF